MPINYAINSRRETYGIEIALKNAVALSALEEEFGLDTILAGRVYCRSATFNHMVLYMRCWVR